jgi:hypothetical protein
MEASFLLSSSGDFLREEGYQSLIIPGRADEVCGSIIQVSVL